MLNKFKQNLQNILKSIDKSNPRLTSPLTRGGIRKSLASFSPCPVKGRAGEGFNERDLGKGFGFSPCPVKGRAGEGFNVLSSDEFRILIACSGGIDSLALLYLAAELRDELHLKLGACYVDHKARPESGSESKFVDKICRELQVPFFPGVFDDSFWESSKSNFEERAREGRYKILEKIAMENDFSYIATAHHRDDQVETVLMRILERGTGLKGLCGIKPVVTRSTVTASKFFSSLNPSSAIPLNPSPALPLTGQGEKLARDFLIPPLVKGEVRRGFGEYLTIIRPMLNISRSEITEYMSGRQYLSDSTNNDTNYRRNLYRKVVIPSLKEALKGVSIEKHLSDLAENARRERSVMEEFMMEFWASVINPGSLTSSEPPLSLSKRGDGGELYLSRALIESKSDDFWMTAFSYLFSFGIFRTHPGSSTSPEPPLSLPKRGDGGELLSSFSHSIQTLKDIVAFIRKRDPGGAYYNPFKFQRDRCGVNLLRLIP